MKENRITQIIAFSIALIILVFCVNFIMQNFMGSKSKASDELQKVEEPFRTDIENNETIQKIKKLYDYGVPEPQNIGKSNLFVEGI